MCFIIWIIWINCSTWTDGEFHRACSHLGGERFSSTLCGVVSGICGLQRRGRSSAHRYEDGRHHHGSMCRFVCHVYCSILRDMKIPELLEILLFFQTQNSLVHASRISAVQHTPTVQRSLWKQTTLSWQHVQICLLCWLFYPEVVVCSWRDIKNKPQNWLTSLLWFAGIVWADLIPIVEHQTKRRWCFVVFCGPVHNSLPLDIRHAATVDTIKTVLKVRICFFCLQ